MTNHASFRTVFALLFVGGLFLSLMAPTALAQRGPGNFSPEQMKERRTQEIEKLIGELDLTEVQADTTRKIMLAGLDEQMKLMDNRSTNDRRGMRAEMAKIQEETNKKLALVLPEEKMNKLKELIQAQQGQRGRRGQGGMN